MCISSRAGRYTQTDPPQALPKGGAHSLIVWSPLIQYRIEDVRACIPIPVSPVSQLGVRSSFDVECPVHTAVVLHTGT